jgi:hypothetical protein
MNMKYTFRANTASPTHRRLADGVTGILRAHAASTVIQPETASVAAEDYELILPPPAPATPPVPRQQETEVVLARLTDAEYDALTTSPHIGIRRAVDAARATGIISEAHPAFAPFVAGADALGIIATTRWAALLAP